ncbi:hypothetical protein IMZ08_04325 [Bacillus luteolus]|uniref:Uncharacterized protein n=1 Tax=Litchfieldia luteola TaxID=682179 RepID=A0ABR9QFL6_9BACI|nr:hypothetical protein [Cytobacillus luteolus]MBE4907285.1 hypothetical protein [Cytobacillus luteolus]MBP1943234.1 hypothetical protein [Cytobacillus luteolus]
MLILFFILLITGGSLFFAFKKKRPQFLLVPFASIFAYFIVEIILFPAPLSDTLKFIFGLR